ncbi:MAG: GNAT family N-acetyltransferase [Legionellaceae bacterium]|nr:GNAT family N-acetyltransferase [Legionellaceae bacterium]
MKISRKHYSTGPMLYEACLTLIDSCFPGIKQLADKGKHYNAHWDKASTPFVYYVKDELVGHLGLIPFQLVINNQHYQAAALHGVCVKEAFRRKGIFTALMQEAMLHVKQHYDLAFLFADEERLYEPFGFKKRDEFDFLLENVSVSHTPHQLRKLNLEEPADLNLMHDLLLKRLPISHRFGIIKEQVIFTLDTLSKAIYYSDTHQVLIAYDIKDETLYLKDIVFTQPVDLHRMIALIPERYSKIVLQFCPDSFKDFNFKLIKTMPEDFIMVSANFDLCASPLRFPETGRC